MQTYQPSRENANPLRLTLNPSGTLEFFGPFNKKSKSPLSLQNSTAERFCFKIKSNAPKNKILVMPKSGIIKPFQTARVVFELLPSGGTLISKPPPPYGLLIQSMIVSSTDVNLQTIWEAVNWKKVNADYLTTIYNQSSVPRSLDTTVESFTKENIPENRQSADLNVAMIEENIRNTNYGKQMQKYQLLPATKTPNVATIVFSSDNSTTQEFQLVAPEKRKIQSQILGKGKAVQFRNPLTHQKAITPINSLGNASKIGKFVASKTGPSALTGKQMNNGTVASDWGWPNNGDNVKAGIGNADNQSATTKTHWRTSEEDWGATQEKTVDISGDAGSRWNQANDTNDDQADPMSGWGEQTQVWDSGQTGWEQHNEDLGNDEIVKESIHYDTDSLNVEYQGLYDYEAPDLEGLCFKAGDVISVKAIDEESDPEWLFGQLNEKEGWFPKNYVEKLVLTSDVEVNGNEINDMANPTEDIKYQGLYDYEAPDVEGLSFKSGDIISVNPDNEESDPEWLLGQINDKAGWFPRNYVEKLVLTSNTEENWNANNNDWGSSEFESNGKSENENEAVNDAWGTETESGIVTGTENPIQNDEWGNSEGDTWGNDVAKNMESNTWENQENKSEKHVGMESGEVYLAGIRPNEKPASSIELMEVLMRRYHDLAKDWVMFTLIIFMFGIILGKALF